MELRKYQVLISEQAIEKIKLYNFVYIAAQVRTGKTLMALNTCKLLNAKKVIFITKKKAVLSIEKDHKDFGFDFELVVINYESLHKLDNHDADVFVYDELHCCSGFPKPGQRAKFIRSMMAKRGNTPVIALSGTPSPENYSQLFHQMWAITRGPWLRYKSFYEWAKDYVDVKQRKIGSHTHNDYSHGRRDLIVNDIADYMITFTQQDAGFSTTITEDVVYVKMKESTYNLADKLFKDRVVEKEDKVILADTPVKMQQKLHQIYSGTILFENGEGAVIDTSKLDYIKEHFNGIKIAIFYQYKNELKAIKEYFGDNVTTDVEEFKSTDKNIALQFVSGREGINLSDAKFLVFYNISFSATTYWQARDRMSTINRISNKVIWLFAEGGIEDKIYQSVKNKRKYTAEYFRKDYKWVYASREGLRITWR